MALTPEFSVVQGLNPQDFTVVDDSTGSDGAIATRRIYPQQSDSSYLNYSGATIDYIPFPLSYGTSIDIVGLLTVDYALSITVQWVNSLGVVLYTKTQSYDFTGNSEQFMYGLVQDIAANRSLLQNNNYVMNCFEIDMFTSYSEKSVETGNDIASAQMLLDFAQGMITEQNKFW